VSVPPSEFRRRAMELIAAQTPGPAPVVAVDIPMPPPPRGGTPVNAFPPGAPPLPLPGAAARAGVTSPHSGDRLDLIRTAILALQHYAEYEDDDQELATVQVHPRPETDPGRPREESGRGDGRHTRPKACPPSGGRRLLVGLCYSRREKSGSWSRSTGWLQVRQRPAQQRKTGCRSSTAWGSVRPTAGLSGAGVPRSGMRARR
jgi:hypothetical protein